jgi:hypothetical protein
MRKECALFHMRPERATAIAKATAGSRIRRPFADLAALRVDGPDSPVPHDYKTRIEKLSNGVRFRLDLRSRPSLEKSQLKMHRFGAQFPED